MYMFIVIIAVNFSAKSTYDLEVKFELYNIYMYNITARKRDCEIINFLWVKTW